MNNFQHFINNKTFGKLKNFGKFLFALKHSREFFKFLIQFFKLRCNRKKILKKLIESKMRGIRNFRNNYVKIS